MDKHLLSRKRTGRGIRMRRRSRMGGAYLVELSVVLPVVMLSVLSISEAGMFFLTNDIMKQGARAAARLAVTGRGQQEGTRDALIRAEAARYTELIPGGGDVQFLVKSRHQDADNGAWLPGAGKPCEVVEIRIEYDYNPTFPMVSALLPDTIPLEATARKVNEPWVRCDL